MLRSIAFIIFIISPLNLRAQYYQFSQLNFTGQRVNPAGISLDNYITGRLAYRTQRSLPGIELTNFLASAKFPFIKSNGGNRWSAVGVMLSSERTGNAGMLQTDGVSATYAANKYLNERNVLSFGTTISYYSRKVNMSGLSTGMQYVDHQGFVQSLDSGEKLADLSTTFGTGNLGLIWVSTNKAGQKLRHAGIALYNINTVDEGIINDGSRISASYSFSAGHEIMNKRGVNIYAELLYTLSSVSKNLNVGFVANHKLDRYDSRLRGQSISVITKYLQNQGAILGAQWHHESLSIGASYDIPLYSSNANNGAFELGISWGIEKQSKYKLKRRRGKKKKNGEDDKIGMRKSSATDSLHMEETDLDVTNNGEAQVDEQDVNNEERKAHVGDFKQLRLNEPLYFNFNFESAKSDLKRSDEGVLDDLVKLLKDNLKVKVKVEGHTDDVGSDEDNMKLSYQRSKAVALYLMRAGIPRSRIENAGFGESKPLVPNDSAENRATNRRVEFVLFESELK